MLTLKQLKHREIVEIFNIVGKSSRLGSVFRRPISANPGLNFNPGLFFFSTKAFSRTVFSILFRVANHQIVDKNS